MKTLGSKTKRMVGRKDLQSARSEETLRDFLEYLIPGITRDTLPAWPPDAFALAAATRHRSGAYNTIFNGSPSDNNWGARMRDTGAAWRDAWTASLGQGLVFPKDVAKEPTPPS